MMKQIAGHSDYEINEDGTIIRRVKCDSGKIRQPQVKPHFQCVKGGIYPNGYWYCTLLTRDKQREDGTFYSGMYYRNIAIHRLVAITWIGQPPPGKPWVNHEDGNKINNHYTNLKWTSISENIQHAFDTGLHIVPSGTDNWNTGKKRSFESKRKMSEAKKGQKHPKYKGYYAIDGKIFHSLQEAANQMLVSTMTIKRRIDRHETGYKFIPTG